MATIHDIAGDRRWIIWHQPETSPPRLIMVVEGERGFFPVGEISNMPDAVPPILLGKNANEAEQICLALNRNHFGYDEQTQWEILASTMQPKRVEVVRDPETDEGTIFIDGDAVLELDGEMAEQLWWKMADAYYEFNCHIIPDEGRCRHADEQE